ncbi:hypothetical protein Tcan_02951 [Toxocara canis]|uniref:Uncharacterized protein n=1 Tax=Toxocara canis TaxID=6265 RepID=A0A0B2W4J8_TOXCA|nr:hypothetical protein Tcan_02951 [Toxocara canis]
MLNCAQQKNGIHFSSLTALESRMGIVGENVVSGDSVPLEVGLLKNSLPSATTSFPTTHQPAGFSSSLPNDGMPPRGLLRKVRLFSFLGIISASKFKLSELLQLPITAMSCLLL